MGNPGRRNKSRAEKSRPQDGSPVRGLPYSLMRFLASSVAVSWGGLKLQIKIGSGHYLEECVVKGDSLAGGGELLMSSGSSVVAPPRLLLVGRHLEMRISSLNRELYGHARLAGALLLRTWD